MPNTAKTMTRRGFLTLAGAGALTLAPSVAFADDDAAAMAETAEAAEALDAEEAQAAVDSVFEETLPGAVNELGEGSFVPGEHLGDEDSLGEESMALADLGGVAINEIKGQTRYETAALEALQAYSSSKYVLVASGMSYADSLAAAGLAGALGCPIVLTERDSLPDVSANAISGLGASTAILLGGEAVIASGAATAISRKAGNVLRLAGETRYGTQMQIWSYGLKNNLWQGDTAYIAAGENFADALSAAPLCFACKAPVFFANGSGYLPNEQLEALKAASQFKNLIVLGGDACVPSGSYSQLSAIASGHGGSITRLAGATRYETSAAVARYAVEKLGFIWDGIAFTSGQLPYDALAGAPLQGRHKSPLLLVDGGNTSSAKLAKGSVSSSIAFFGGYSAIPVATRVSVCSELGLSLYEDVSVTSYGVTLEDMASMEEQVDKRYGKVSYSDFYNMLDPGKYTYKTVDFLQFAVLNGGYSNLSASALNEFVASNCGWSESSYGRQSVLKNAGAAFVAAAKETGVNEAYLLAHSVWESAWGCSQLACGWTADRDYTVTFNGKEYYAKKGTTYYNLYGIGAYDESPISGGRAMAVKEGWTSVDAAVLGAAKWIKSNYHDRGAGRQNTLYLMKFDLPDAQKSSPSVWHQYCTGGNSWVLGIAKLMNSCYSSAGYDTASVPLKFDVPSYA